MQASRIERSPFYNIGFAVQVTCLTIGCSLWAARSLNQQPMLKKWTKIGTGIAALVLTMDVLSGPTRPEYKGARESYAKIAATMLHQPMPLLTTGAFFGTSVAVVGLGKLSPKGLAPLLVGFDGLVMPTIIGVLWEYAIVSIPEAK